MRRALLVILAALLAGCGSAAEPGPAPGGPPRARVDRAPLKVAPTQLRLGDATTANDRSGSRALPVGPRRVVPQDLRPGGGRRDGVGAGANCTDGDLLPDGANDAAVHAATLCLLNGERTDAGLVALRANARLADAAVGHSRDMVANQFFGHTAADGRDLVGRVRAAGYIDPRKAWTVGENIAWGSGTLSTPASMVAAWMASPGHKANLLNPVFREVGIGIVPGSPRGRGVSGAATYTTDFGTVGDPDAQPVAAAAATAPKPRAARRTPARGQRRRRAKRRKLAGRMQVRARVALGPGATPPGQ